MIPAINARPPQLPGLLVPDIRIRPVKPSKTCRIVEVCQRRSAALMHHIIFDIVINSEHIEHDAAFPPSYHTSLDNGSILWLSSDDTENPAFAVNAGHSSQVPLYYWSNSTGDAIYRARQH
jgi:hypothetical protein